LVEKYGKQMNKIVKAAFMEEMQKAKEYYDQSDWENSFKRLERAHVLGQRNAISHSVSHWWMMKLALKQKNAKEIVGQIPRLLFGGLASLLGKVPIGNTGGANLGIMQPMIVPKDIQEIFDKLDV
jgi:hypothetical protein